MSMYKAEIRESSREFTKRDKLRFTDTGNADSLNDLTKGGKFRLAPVDFALVHVTNPNAKPDKMTGEVRDEYDVFIIADKNGDMYQTSSASFYESFRRIWDVMTEDDPEEFEIDVARVPSANNSGDYLTCYIV